jgi:hypothetical protein
MQCDAALATRRTTRIFAIAGALAWVLIQAAAPAQAQPAAGVYTYHDDTMRTGAVTNETHLTPFNVSTQTFGKLFSGSIDGYAYAQPLYVPGVSIPGSGAHNVVYVATEHDAVYAFDADSGALLWQKSLLPPGATTVGFAAVQCLNLTPEIGITGTPVIDPSTGTMYVVAKTKENSSYFHRLHALDIATGAEKFGGPVAITASVPGTGPGSVGGIFTMDPLKALQRSALLLKGGVVYIAFASNCDVTPYDGWVLGYDASDLSQDYAFNAAPDGSEAGIWMSGCGPAASPQGPDLYVSTGNGTFDANLGGPDYGDSVVRLSPGADQLEPADYFTPSNQQYLEANDLDLGSAGVVLLPDQTSGPPHLMVTSSKQGTIYLIDRDDMGGYNPSGDQIVQEFTGAVLEMFGTPSFWNGTMYTVGVNDVPKAFALSSGKFTQVPVSHSSVKFSYPGATTSVSSNGNSDGILWAIQGGPGSPNAILYAFDAADLSHELYDANQNPTRDLGSGTYVKFAVPTVAAGKVYIGTSSELDAYGLIDATPGGIVSVTSPGAPSLKRHRWISGGTFTVTNTGTATEPISSVAIQISNAALFSRAKMVAKAGRVHRKARTGALQRLTTFILNRPLMLPAGQTATFTLRLKGAGGTSASAQQVQEVSADIYWFTGLPASLGSIAPMAASTAAAGSRQRLVRN